MYQLKELEEAVADAAYYLPAYDARASLSAAAALGEQTRTLRAKLAPRKKFKFASRGQLDLGTPAITAG